MHYGCNPYKHQYPLSQGHPTGPGAPAMGMQGDVYHQQQDRHGGYSPDPCLQPYVGTFQPMGGPYLQFQVPCFEMENSQVPPSGLPAQGDSQTHSGYINPDPAYCDINGYYYHGQPGQPNSQFRPAPVICRSPYPEASGPPHNPSAYPNPLAEHGNTFGEVRIHSEHDAPQPSGSLSSE
ncbi:hypothetical protein PAXRUDRAFT_781699 [Paxillus rubicundulus Ve08.2h10]|uniref:Uncharacterized protein n=1 Tax=Paxillus rubicundulus Ve08.2h10 TaxID=930991 RepID=A0A0D0E886_9AGAM|nr:hypothetical protein PAXRUDRAFT_781699 [Paxillus rubicundulus Ve08.2h10]